MDKTRSEMVARTCFEGPRLFAVIRDELRTFYNGVGFVKRHFHPCGLGAGRGAPQALIADP